jgi:hypothetical protein
MILSDLERALNFYNIAHQCTRIRCTHIYKYISYIINLLVYPALI